MESELDYRLRLAVEAKVLADVNATSGIQSQAYATSVLTTLRKGLTKLEVRLRGQLDRAAPHRLGRRGAGAVHERGGAPEPAVRPGQPSAVRCADRGHRQQAAGVGHVLATDAVVVDTDTLGVGRAVVGDVQHRRLREEPDPGPVRGPVRHLGAARWASSAAT